MPIRHKYKPRKYGASAPYLWRDGSNYNKYILSVARY